MRSERVALKRAFFVGLLVVGAGCGDSSSSTGFEAMSTTTGIPDPPQPTPATRVTEPRPATTTTTTMTLPPIENLNDRSTPMGELCWQIFQVNFDLFPLFERGYEKERFGRLLPILENIEKRVGPVVDKLPPEVVPFGQRFLAEVRAAQTSVKAPGSDPVSVRDAVIQRLFGEIERYPGYGEFINADPGCRWPPEPAPVPTPPQSSLGLPSGRG